MRVLGLHRRSADRVARPGLAGLCQARRGQAPSGSARPPPPAALASHPARRKQRVGGSVPEETPPSHDEFPSAFCRAEPVPVPLPLPLPLLGGRPPAPVTLPLPVVPAAPAVPSPTHSPVSFPPAAPSPRPPRLPSPLPAAPLALTLPPHHPAVRPIPAPAATPVPPPAPAPAAPQGSPPPHQFSPQPGAPAPSSAPLQPVDSPSNASQDDDLLGQESRRRTGSGTREVHNKLEKNRRAHLKECFEMLKRQLPTCQEEKKCSNLSILHAAIRYIQSLRRKERDYEHEMERLAREKISAQQRLACLKKDLAQWDHIDVNALYPDCVDSPTLSARVRMPSPASTSTASGFPTVCPAAELEGGMIIDEDEDDDDDDETMSFHSGRQRSASDSSSAMPTYCTPQPPPSNGGPAPSLRELHGYRGESPQVPPQVRARSPISPRPASRAGGLPLPPVSRLRLTPHVLPQRTASPVVSRAGVNGHALDASGRGASAPSSGYVPAKLLNYSIKVASPATSASVSPPAPSPVGPVGVLTRVPSSPVGSQTTLPAPVPVRARASPPPPHRAGLSPPEDAPSASPVAPVALPLTSHHIQLPAQVMNNGRWLGVSPAILQLTSSPNQRLVLEPAALSHHSTSNGATPLVTHHRIRESPHGSPNSTPHGSPVAVAAAAAAAAAITMPSTHANKVLVGATGLAPAVAIVGHGHGDGFHKSSSPDGIRPGAVSKGLHLANETNGHMLTAAVPSLPTHTHPHHAHVVSTHVVSTHPSLSPLVTPVTVMSQAHGTHGGPITHILATSPIGKVSPLVKVSPQYIGAVVKPPMVVVSNTSTHPPNSGV
ncbi:hypothetical protein ONE63_010916 [Megalurothrips usitatus]|uniref:Max-binding protein MNT n=1 Tax=Megalurothrips usitatus TaxID=439358 RepID=A0AAV7XLW2_9NEOP|nr:hypothetical protein ONE63_010916 [Megalurothrips usitatus]